jgi:hypothetical protein
MHPPRCLHVATQAGGFAPHHGLWGGVQWVRFSRSVGVDCSRDGGRGAHAALEGAPSGVRVVRAGQGRRGPDGAVGPCDKVGWVVVGDSNRECEAQRSGEARA